MKQLMIFAPLALFLNGCGSPADVAAGDRTLAGAPAAVGNGANPGIVANRPVWVGRNANRRADACTRRVEISGDGIAAYWAPATADAPTAVGPVKATVTGTVLACDVQGAWTGIIFGGPGQSVDYCNLARRIAGPTEYQGPCRQGWVRTADLVG